MYIDTTNNSSGRICLNAGNADTATNVAWSGVTDKPGYYDAKAVKDITRNGTTFTYTCMDGTTGTFTQQDNNTTYSAGTGLTLSSQQFSVSKANASAILNLLGSATANMGSDAYVITSDAADPSDGLFYKRPASKIVNSTLVKAALGTGSGTSKYLREDGTWVKPPYLSTSGGTLSGSITISHTTDATMDSTTQNPRVVFAENGAQPVALVYTDYDAYRNPAGLKVIGLSSDASAAWFEVEGNIYASKVYGAVWNDYAEYRAQEETIEPGYCVTTNRNGQVFKTNKRMQYCEGIVSDTFGFAIGETNECKTPLAVSGRVLAYYEDDINSYEIGDVVCAGASGKITKMTREEIKEYPDRIVGTVSEFPTYDSWGTGNVSTKDRIWIKVK